MLVREDILHEFDDAASVSSNWSNHQAWSPTDLHHQHCETTSPSQVVAFISTMISDALHHKPWSPKLDDHLCSYGSNTDLDCMKTSKHTYWTSSGCLTACVSIFISVGMWVLVIFLGRNVWSGNDQIYRSRGQQIKCLLLSHGLLKRSSKHQ